MLKILQINYRINSAISDFLNASAPVAEILAAVPGLRWKIWLSNEEKQEGGGVYLFENEAELKSFVDVPIIAKLKSNPAVAEVTLKEFAAPLELSNITRAPI